MARFIQAWWQVQPDEAADGGREQGGRRRREVPRREGRQGRSEQDRDHALEPLSPRRSRRASPFNWKDLTPVQMMASNQFVLWVNADTPYKTPQEYIDAVKKAGANKFKWAARARSRKDQIITVAVEKQTGAKFTYIPYKGGGEIAVQLVGKHIDSS